MGVAMHACEAAGELRIGRFFSLPRWEQDLWRAHIHNRLSGRYEAPPKRGRRGRSAPPAKQLEDIRKFHERRKGEP